MTIPDTLDLTLIKGGHVIVADEAFRFDIANTALQPAKALGRYFVASTLELPFKFATEPMDAFVRWGKWWKAVVCTPGVDDNGGVFWRIEADTEVVS